MDTLIMIYTGMFFFGIYFLLFFVVLYFQHKKELYSYPKPTKLPLVSFLVPAYNEEDSLSGTLNALLEVDYPRSKKEIIVINDGSKDKTINIIKKFVKKHKEIKLLDKKNTGKADSLNQAIKISKGNFIAVVDADSHPSKESLKMMIGYFEEDKKVAAVTSKVWVKNKKGFMGYFQDFDYAVIAWSRKVLDFIGCVYVTNGPFSIYRKNLVKKVGGFDPKNMTEDIELTWNLLSKEYKTKMSYSAKVHTVVPDNLNIWIKQRIRWNIGGLQTLNKYKGYYLKKENLFTRFVMTYVAASFLLALFGLALFLRYLYLIVSPYLFSFPYFFRGYNPFLFFDFYFGLTILFILGLTFFVLSIIFHKIAIKNTEVKNPTVLTIIIYTFVYRPLYMIPFIITFYKLMKGDIRWYTK